MIFMLQGGQGNTGRKGNKGPRGDPGPPGPPAQAGEAGDADVCFLTFQYLNTQHLFVLQTIIVFQRKSCNHIDFAFLRNCFLSCGSNTINHASYEMCMRKIPCDKDSVSTLKSSNSVKFQFSHVFCRSRSFFPRSRSFFCLSRSQSRRWKTRSLHSSRARPCGKAG